MADPDLTSVVIGGLGMIAINIIKDWFLGIKKHKVEACEEGAPCMLRIQALERKMSDQENASLLQGRELSSIIALFEERTASIMRELKAGSDRFIEQAHLIADIQQTLARLEALVSKGRS
jgi:hypothetical protein